MVKWAFIFLFGLVVLGLADDPANVQFSSGFEHLAEATGSPFSGGGAFNTTGSLSHDGAYSGDSCAYSRITAPTDTDNQSAGGYKPHRFHLEHPFLSSYLTGIPHGTPIQCPCMYSMWVYHSGIILHAHSGGRDTDWVSDYTETSDSTDAYNNVLATNIDSMGHPKLGHVPYFGQTTHVYQADRANDPKCRLCFVQGVWNNLTLYTPADTFHTAVLWLNGQEVSRAYKKDMNGTVAQAHDMMYTCAACGADTTQGPWIFKNDNVILKRVPGGENEVKMILSVLRYPANQ